jgi:hypothetical protein
MNDHARRGFEDLESIKQTIDSWSTVLDPEWMNPFGGEPLLHPQFKEICLYMREKWPNAGLMIATNGLLLDRIMDPGWLEAVKPIDVHITQHRADLMDTLRSKMRAFLSLHTGWKHGLVDNSPQQLNAKSKSYGHEIVFSMQRDGMALALDRTDRFNKVYRTLPDGSLRPWDSDPQEAHRTCMDPGVVYLYRNQLWKCRPYANMQEVIPDFAQHWPAYSPYSIDDDLGSYFDKRGQPESICSMCPTERDEAEFVDHTDPANVQVLGKKQINNSKEQ